MQTTNQKWTIGILVIVVVLIGIGLLTRPAIKAPVADSTNTSTTTSSGASSTPTFSQEVIPTLNVPDFRKPVNYSPTLAADVREAIQKNVATLKDRLTKDSLDLKSWIDLGTMRKIAGDYKGAEEAWVFVTQASPNNPIAYSNLGDLYTNFIKDYPKAEKAYLTVIRVDPTNASAYRDLAALHDNLYKKGTGAGEAILKKGVAASPDSVDLHVILARYYKDAGRVNEARVQLDAAIAAAKKSGQPDVAVQLQTEKDQL